jgi:hypothetical protein
MSGYDGPPSRFVSCGSGQSDDMLSASSPTKQAKCFITHITSGIALCALTIPAYVFVTMIVYPSSYKACICIDKIKLEESVLQIEYEGRVSVRPT